MNKTTVLKSSLEFVITPKSPKVGVFLSSYFIMLRTPLVFMIAYFTSLISNTFPILSCPNKSLIPLHKKGFSTHNIP